MKLLLVLGNGFTIDFIEQLEAQRILAKDTVDVRNLFRFGHTVKFPNTSCPGFLSFKHSPCLWTLGARPHKSLEESTNIIEEIITCSNMLSDYLCLPAKKQRFSDVEPPIHIKAYLELIIYLKSLFASYNEKVSDEEILNFVKQSDWGWLELFRAIKKGKYESVTVVTYNYDIWLERILKSLDIKFSIDCIEKKQKPPIKILKPHGSISFSSKIHTSPIIEITYKNFKTYLESVNINSLCINYKDMGNHSKSFLIPPAGDSTRLTSCGWAGTLREKINKYAEKLDGNDAVVICGMSYWHVDRRELDSLLINLNNDVNICLVNPKPPKDLNAVLMSLFRRYTVYADAKMLGGFIND